MIMQALELQYQAEIEKAKANIKVYLENPAGIGEHPDLVGAVDSQMDILAHAEDKLEAIRKYYTPASKV